MSNASRIPEEPSHVDAPRLPRRPPDAWDDAARRLVRAEMVRRGISYFQLSRLMAEMPGGRTISPEALGVRVGRGTFSFGFALLVLRALNVKTLSIVDLDVR